jgi:acetyl-CoA carboxylase carboxyltransferase component
MAAKKSRKKTKANGAKRTAKRKVMGVEGCVKAITRPKLAKLPTKKLESVSEKLRDRFSDTEVLLSQR